MYQSIQPVLANGWQMFYHPCWPITRLTPVCDLAQCLDQCNSSLRLYGRNLAGWSSGDRYQIARLVRAHWIYTHLGTEPIRKPVLAHRESSDLIVDCGDTRLMALALRDPASTVGVVVFDRSRHPIYHDWIMITSDQDLRYRTGFAADADILVRMSDDGAVEWMEIGDATTAHHLHDFDLRVRMMENYLQRQEQDFQFDSTWARSPIDWTAYLADH